MAVSTKSPGTPRRSSLDSQQRRKNDDVNDTAHLFPDLFRDWSLADNVTACNAFCGMLALFFCQKASCALSSSSNQTDQIMYLRYSILCMFLGGVADVFDGWVARVRGASSPFGKDLDSLSDFLSFGIAPAFFGYVVMGIIGESEEDQLGELSNFIILPLFVVAGLARLARFNATADLLAGGHNRAVKYWEGVPIPTNLIIVLIGWVDMERRLAGGYFNGGGVTDLKLECWHYKLMYLVFTVLLVCKLKFPKPDLAVIMNRRATEDRGPNYNSPRMGPSSRPSSTLRSKRRSRSSSTKKA